MKKPTRKEIKEKFISRQMKHNRLVQDYMILLENNRKKLPFEIKEWELLRKAVNHDTDKFSERWVEDYVTLGEFYDNKKAGISNEHINKETLHKCSDYHSFNTPHHIKYHSKHNTCPSNLDICEMCCDWAAHSTKNGIEDNTKFFRETLVHEEKLCKERKGDFLKVLRLLKKLKKQNS